MGDEPGVLLRTKSVIALTYPEDDGSGRGRVQNHICPLPLGADVEKRIKDTYGFEPKKREEGRFPIFLDAGGMVFTDFPYIRVRCRGFSVKYKLEHAAVLYGPVEDRLNDLTRRRTYGGRECVTIYTRFWILVLPVEDVKTILRSLKKHALESATRAEARILDLKASSQHVLIERPPAAES